MRTEVLKEDTVDEAAEKILYELKDDASGTSRSRGGNNVIYFDGWDGLGAAAVLRAVDQRLRLAAPATGAPEFSHIFHINCSKWESRRVMQRLIVEQLKLPSSVMEIFDAQDEEDAYQGLSKGSRTEIPRVSGLINQHILKLVTNQRFLVIIHNGSSEEIDLGSLGFPLLDQYSWNKVLWSFQGRFRFYPRTKVDRALKNTRTTDVFLSAYSSDMGEDKLSDILGHEAEEVARRMVNTGGFDWHAAATNFFLYMMKLRSMGDHINDYDISTHACNYWRCDGIIQTLQQGRDIGTDDGVDKLWLSSVALHHEIQLDEDYYQNPNLQPQRERRLHKRMACWSSPTYGFMLIPDLHGKIPEGMFHQFNKLRVLKLSTCKFSFTSPPFLCCHNLRFLWLDRCQEGSCTTEAVKEEDIHLFLQRLWVLDVRYSYKAFLSKEMMDFMTQLRELNVVGVGDHFDIDLVQSRLHNIRRLRVKKSLVDSSFFFSRMDNMELLDLSTNFYWRNNISVERCSSLETIIINGSVHLRYISLMGCAKLKNILLSGSSRDLQSICITGAAVEIIDFSAMTAPRLDDLCLLNCEKLCAILWPPATEDRRKKYLNKLHIDTTQKADTTAVAGENHARPSEFDWHISVRDARIIQSLESVKDYFGPNHAHVEISSPSYHTCPDDAGSKDDKMKSSSGKYLEEKMKHLKDIAIYTDVTVTLNDNKKQKRANEGEAPSFVSSQGCYIHIEDQTGPKLKTASTTIPEFICDSAKVLHVHDSFHITNILAAPLTSPSWNQLEWCRVERCPMLRCVFSPQFGRRPESNNDMFKKLRTVWASHLPKARYIWNWSGTSTTWLYGGTFQDLKLLHHDCCPRLVHIIHFPLVENALDRLETLEIMWCGDLSVAFYVYDTPELSLSNCTGWTFTKLKNIHLHELPKLQNICNIGLKLDMPELETIKIRGCWSLRTLLIVGSKNMVQCDCEKEWWHRLEWESEEHAKTYKPTHPRYYKKAMLKGSVLR